MITTIPTTVNTKFVKVTIPKASWIPTTSVTSTNPPVIRRFTMSSILNQSKFSSMAAMEIVAMTLRDMTKRVMTRNLN